MSLIRLYAKERLSPSALSELRDATGRSAVDLVRAAEAGSPIAEFLLFKKDHDEIASRIRRLLDNVTEKDIRTVECVTDPRRSSESCHESSFEVIRNILDEAEQISRDLDDSQ
jgi:hypothetical protein